MDTIRVGRTSLSRMERDSHRLLITQLLVNSYANNCGHALVNYFTTVAPRILALFAGVLQGSTDVLNFSLCQIGDLDLRTGLNAIHTVNIIINNSCLVILYIYYITTHKQ